VRSLAAKWSRRLTADGDVDVAGAVVGGEVVAAADDGAGDVGSL
jgi:hypothetical protein